MAMAASPSQLHQWSRPAQQTLHSTPVLPEELIVEILSRVPVKSLIRFRCVSRSWNSRTFDPSFIKLHLQRSARNIHVLLTFEEQINPNGDLGRVSGFRKVVAPCSIPHLIENPFSTINDCYRCCFNVNLFVLGACNGLVCLLDSLNFGYESNSKEYWVRFWNPATKIMSHDSPRLSLHWSDSNIIPFSVLFGFGFDDSCDTYKVVAILMNSKSQEREVRVHCLGDNCWRKVLTCPAFPILDAPSGKFVSGTLNWLALGMSSLGYHWKTVTLDQLIIFSYDIKNKTYKYLLMPDGLSEVPRIEPDLTVLKGCLCLSHDHKETHFVVWLMREFGIEKSWTQLLNVSYSYPQIHDYPRFLVKPLCMSENEDVIFLDVGLELLVYNLIDNRVYRDHGIKDNTFVYLSHEYVQSLVLPY